MKFILYETEYQIPNKLSDKILREFACSCALDVAHLWNMPKIVKQYLTTQDESIRDAAARAAADAAAWAAADAAGAAARAAARAAGDAARAADATAGAVEAAADAAWAAARDAADAAAAGAAAWAASAAWAAGAAAWAAAKEQQHKKLKAIIVKYQQKKESAWDI